MGDNEIKERPYGLELILDLHDCDVSTFNRKSLKAYFIKLCDAIDMKRDKLYFWDDAGLPPEECQNLPHLKGISAVQFILTSNIVIHTLDLLNSAYINIFSCKPFDREITEKFTVEWFGAGRYNSHFIERI